MCVCVFVLVFVLVWETVPVGKKLISSLVSPRFLEATEGNPLIYAAGNGREETICIPESSQPSCSNPQHLFPFVIGIKRVISDGFFLRTVSSKEEAFRHYIHSAEHCHVPLGCLTYPSWILGEFVLEACIRMSTQKIFTASAQTSVFCIYLIFEEIMV